MRGEANRTSLPQFHLDRLLTDRLTGSTPHCLPISLSAGKAEPRLSPWPSWDQSLGPNFPIKKASQGQSDRHTGRHAPSEWETRGRNEGQRRGRGKPTYSLSLSLKRRLRGRSRPLTHSPFLTHSSGDLRGKERKREGQGTKTSLLHSEPLGMKAQE